MNTSKFFDHYYNNAQVNSILIMDPQGTILDVNDSFTKTFGYKNEDIKGKNFIMLFNESDRLENKHLIELETVLIEGQADDENYVVDDKGHQIWCTGESILVHGNEKEKYIVKDIVSLQAKKQLQLLLTASDELLETIFESSSDIPMMVLDGAMRVQKINGAFMRLFEINATPEPGSRLSELDHPFWNSPDIKKEVSKIVVNNEPLRHREFTFFTRKGERKIVRADSKIIDKESVIGRMIFIIIEDISPRVSSTNRNFKHSL
jgi:PAS domain S-box-containing protein